jgi:hypothetical protein
MKIEFEFQTPHGVFRDALHLPEDHKFTDAEIEVMKQQRVDNWVILVETPPVLDEQPDFIEIDGVRYAKVSDNG